MLLLIRDVGVGSAIVDRDIGVVSRVPDGEAIDVRGRLPIVEVFIAG